MAGQRFRYEALTATQLQELDRARTLAFMALSPLEVHGPHLPTGTDLLVALELQRRIMERVRERWPEIDFLILPPAYVGADLVPDPSSLEVDSRVVYHLLLATGRCLAAQGFRSLVLTDNHGGPRHQIAIEKAARRLQRRYGFALVAPSQRFCRLMVEQDPRRLAERGITPGSGGDVTDAHAGTGETATVLAFAPELILPQWRELPRAAVPDGSLPKRLLAAVSAAVAWLVGARLAGDLARLGHTLGWIGMKPMPTYLGDPAQASAELGEQLLEGHVAEAMSMLEEVRAGKPPFSEPVLWGLRFIEGS